MRVRDVLGGALLVNAIPHLIVGVAGKRSMTPFGGANSTAAANLAWAGVNLAAGSAALAPLRWRDLDQEEADHRLRSVTVGTISMAAFAAASELIPMAARHRQQRAQAAGIA